MSAYATTDEIREFTKLKDGSYDLTLDMMADAATELIDNHCNRSQDGFLALATAAPRVFAGDGTGILLIDECISVESVAVKQSPEDSVYQAWLSSDWIAFSGNPNAPFFNRTPYQALMIAPGGSHSHFTSGKYSHWQGFKPIEDDSAGATMAPTVQVTARWGYAEKVPNVIKKACIIQVGRWFARSRSSYADTVGNRESGQLMYKQVLDPDIKEILDNGRLKRPYGST